MNEHIQLIKNQLGNRKNLFLKINEDRQDGRYRNVSLTKDEAKSLIEFYSEISYQISMIDHLQD